MFHDFIDTPKCRCCETQSEITQEEFERRVEELVGDEYTVIGEVTTLDKRVKIKHNTCGHVQNFLASDFLSGSRCPQCYEKISMEMLENMLREYADNRYTIIENDGYKITLFDNEMNKEIRLRFKHIIQEMLRPTPSNILPTSKTNNMIKPLSTWDRWYQLCIDYKNEFGHICPTHTEKYKGHALGDWCSAQRIAFNKGLLSDNKIQLLKDIDFIFDGVFYAWNKRFEEYKEFVQDTGNYFPGTDAVHKGHKVGAWFLGQRKERKKGKLNPKYEKLLLEYCPEFFKERRSLKNQ